MLEISQIIPLKDLCDNYKKDIVDGPFGANLKREHYISEGVPILKIQNVKPFEIILKKMDFVSSDKAAELQRHAYKKGDIIITKLGMPLGASAIVGEEMDDGVIVADLVRVRASNIDTRYLCYHLNSPNTCDYLNAQSSGATRPRVKISAVRELPIYTPPLPEQKRIVAILDEAFAGISLAVANAEKNLANARELFDSYLNDIFTQRGDGWEERPLGEVIQITHGFAFKGADFEVSNNRKLPIVLTPGNYTGDASLSFTDKNTKRLLIESPEGYLFHKDDLTIVMTDLSSKMKILGKPAFIENEFILHNQRIGRILFIEPTLDKRFLYYYLQTRQVSDNIKETATGTMVRHTAPVRILSNQISFPVEEEQKEIVEELDLLKSETQHLEAIYQQKLTALNELKQSILQKTFTGELTQRQENV